MSLHSNDYLSKVKIGKDVNSISGTPFHYCNSLKKIIVENDNSQFSNDEYGVLFNKNKSTIIQYPYGREITFYSIPVDVTKIETYCFQQCQTITNIEIPTSITSIESNTFYNCISLEIVKWPISFSNDFSSIFYGCSKLTKLILYGEGK